MAFLQGNNPILTNRTGKFANRDKISRSNAQSLTESDSATVWALRPAFEMENVWDRRNFRLHYGQSRAVSNVILCRLNLYFNSNQIF
jgi:hypothetical protein